jgi:hypothetical protein
MTIVLDTCTDDMASIPSVRRWSVPTIIDCVHDPINTCFLMMRNDMFVDTTLHADILKTLFYF